LSSLRETLKLASIPATSYHLPSSTSKASGETLLSLILPFPGLEIAGSLKSLNESIPKGYYAALKQSPVRSCWSVNATSLS
jgi:hypothetical protein